MAISRVPVLPFMKLRESQEQIEDRKPFDLPHVPRRPPSLYRRSEPIFSPEDTSNQDAFGWALEMELNAGKGRYRTFSEPAAPLHALQFTRPKTRNVSERLPPVQLERLRGLDNQHQTGRMYYARPGGNPALYLSELQSKFRKYSPPTKVTSKVKILPPESPLLPPIVVDDVKTQPHIKNLIPSRPRTPDSGLQSDFHSEIEAPLYCDESEKRKMCTPPAQRLPPDDEGINEDITSSSVSTLIIEHEPKELAEETKKEPVKEKAPIIEKEIRTHSPEPPPLRQVHSPSPDPKVTIKKEEPVLAEPETSNFVEILKRSETPSILKEDEKVFECPVEKSTVELVPKIETSKIAEDDLNDASKEIEEPISSERSLANIVRGSAEAKTVGETRKKREKPKDEQKKKKRRQPIQRGKERPKKDASQREEEEKIGEEDEIVEIVEEVETEVVEVEDTSATTPVEEIVDSRPNSAEERERMRREKEAEREKRRLAKKAKRERLKRDRDAKKEEEVKPEENAVPVAEAAQETSKKDSEALHECPHHEEDAYDDAIELESDDERRRLEEEERQRALEALRKAREEEERRAREEEEQRLAELRRRQLEEQRRLEEEQRRAEEEMRARIRRQLEEQRARQINRLLAMGQLQIDMSNVEQGQRLTRAFVWSYFAVQEPEEANYDN